MSPHQQLTAAAAAAPRPLTCINHLLSCPRWTSLPTHI